jgi:hypothetical protein
MTLREIIDDIAIQDEEGVVYIRRVADKILPTSEAIVLLLTEEERGFYIADIAELHCPGFEYFLEINLISEMVEDVKNAGFDSVGDDHINRIIYYAEFDA